jgi:SAM-dependent methyltransferase
MSQITEKKPAKSMDWDAIYRQGTPAWETGAASTELVRVLDDGLVLPGSALELGCGTGADAICLYQRGFDVTAVDISPMAIERARGRSEQEDALVRFVQADVFQFAATAGQFDFVFDAGFYHYVRPVNLDSFLDVLWRVTRPGSFYLSLMGAASETAEGGPPKVSEEEIHNELGRLFEFVQVRRFRFESPHRRQGYRGWSCLMRRPTPKNK